MAYSYRYLEDRASLPSTSSSSCSDTGESSRTSTSYSDDLRKELRTANPDFDDLHYPFPAQPTSSPSFIRRHPVFCSIASIFWGCIAGIHIAFPFPTTIPVFVGAALGLLAFTTLDWYRLFTSIYASRRRSDTPSPLASPCIAPTTRCSNDTPRPPPYTPHPQQTVNVSRVRKIRLIVSTALILFWLHLGITPPAEHVPVLHRSVPSRPEKYFIAANMYNNEDVFEGWSQELLKLCDYLGHNSTFISIYESNSVDSTPELLNKFSQRLTHVNIPHRFVSTTDDNRHWSYSTSRERIQYLADVRNRAMEPLQSADDNVRLPDWEDFTRVIFINDVIYKWESVVRLIATRLDEDETKAGEYDLACGLDFAISGLYDTWVARDICGTPFRIFWPYAKDQLSIDRIKKEKPVEVAACWNGVVVFPAKPYMYQPPVDTHMKVQKRSWRMIDNSTYPGSVSSPAISNPPKFRSTGIEACDHSECFLFSYDLHRIHNTRERPPRILINPTVKVAYKKHWFRWHTTVLRIPAIKWWLELWSRGYPFKIVEWMWEYGSRRRDYCTWSAFNMPDRCPKLPGAWDMSWNEG